jgi:hypothetical protein
MHADAGVKGSHSARAGYTSCGRAMLERLQRQKRASSEWQGVRPLCEHLVPLRLSRGLVRHSLSQHKAQRRSSRRECERISGGRGVPGLARSQQQRPWHQQRRLWRSPAAHTRSRSSAHTRAGQPRPATPPQQATRGHSEGAVHTHDTSERPSQHIRRGATDAHRPNSGTTGFREGHGDRTA